MINFDKRFTEAQKLWIEALLSGKYSQAHSSLENATGFCCLGLGCLVYEEATGKKLPRRRTLGGKSRLIGSDLSSDEEYLAVQRWLNLNSEIGSPKFLLICLNGVELEFDNLAGMNDEGYTFEDIAQHLIKYPEIYFDNFNNKENNEEN